MRACMTSRAIDSSLEGSTMRTNTDDLLYNADDIRSIVIRARMLGLRRERVLAALTRPLLTRPLDDPLTGLVVRRIFDEEWPSENG